ncbi:hypothetical protein G6F23_015780 [Rhizopus arrhizus]|nr:hypothetical protein G6F23_015780 [Rhizopus arrhizus]
MPTTCWLEPVLDGVAYRARPGRFAKGRDGVIDRAAFHVLGHVHAGREGQARLEHIAQRGQRGTAARRHRRAAGKAGCGGDQAEVGCASWWGRV